MSAKPIPDGFHSITPYLAVKNAADAIEFYKNVFGATEIMRLVGPAGKVMHSEIRIGDSPVMLADECEQMNFLSPKSFGGTSVSICLYVEDVDDLFDNAVKAGANVKMPVTDQFYGDRSATLEDPFGHTWTIATHKEDVPHEEMQKRFDDFMTQQANV